jgi:hypothetical protein
VCGIKRDILIVTAILLIGGVVGFGVGRWTAPHSESTNVAAMLDQLRPGDTLTLDSHNATWGGWQRGESETGPIRDIKAKDTGTYNRFFSWFGMGANDAASQHQGMKVDPEGGFIGGSHRGTGILERAWAWAKDVFWVFAVGGVILLVLAFIPATSGVASTILRMIASVFPVIGSTTEKAISYFTAQKPLAQVVDGGEGFKKAIAALPERLPTESGENYTVGQKKQIKTIFQDEHADAQTGSTPAIVKGITE